MDILFRHYNPDTDHDFLISSFLNSYIKGSLVRGRLADFITKMPAEIFYNYFDTRFHKLLDLPSTQIIIASVKDAPDEILGFSIATLNTEPAILHYVYVKLSYRKIKGLSLGTKLVEKVLGDKVKEEVFCAHRSFQGEQLLNSMGLNWRG